MQIIFFLHVLLHKIVCLLEEIMTKIFILVWTQKMFYPQQVQTRNVNKQCLLNTPNKIHHRNRFYRKWISFTGKLLSGNKILTITKGHTCVVNLLKLTRNNQTRIWSTSVHMQNLVKVYQCILKILSENEILTITKGHNCLIYLQKLRRNNPNVELVNINA